MKECVALCGYSPRNGQFLYVSALPGDGGKDWEWTADRKKAIALTSHWQRRFAAGARGLNLRGWFCSPVGEHRESTPGDYYDQKRKEAEAALASGDSEALERARYVGD